MPPPPVPRPTDAELAILSNLWEHGPSTVRQVHDRIGEIRAIGYTTVLKTLQIMTEKGLVLREESGRSHIYRAGAAEATTQRRLVGDLLDRAFGGSARKLILHALSAKKASRKDLEEIRRLIDEMEDKTK